MAKRILAFLVVIAVLAGLLALSQWRPPPDTVSGFVEADDAPVGSRVGGRVGKVHVEEGADVKVGDLLVELEPFDLKDRLAEARAGLAAQQAALDKARAGFRVEEVAQAQARVAELQAQLDLLLAGARKEDIAAAEAQLALAQAELDLAEQKFQRTDALYRQNTATRDALDQVTSEKKRATALVRARQEELDKLRSGARPEEIAAARAQLEQAQQAYQLTSSGYRKEDVDAAEASVAAAAAAVEVIQRQIDELTVRAPIDGVVEAIDLTAGELVSPGTPVISLVDTSKLWVRAYVPENRLDLKVGHPVQVSVDSFPGERFAGRITFISREAEFTPGNVQTPEERSKQVFRIKVGLEEGLDRLRAGMAADVWLDARGPER